MPQRNSKLKILQIAPPFLPIKEEITYGGIERIVWHLDKAYNEAGYESHVAAPSDSKPIGVLRPTIKQHIGADFTNFGRNEVFLRLEHLAGSIRHANSGYDIVHSHDDNLLTFLDHIDSPALLTLHSTLRDFWHANMHPDIVDATHHYNLASVSNALKQQYEKDGFYVRFVVHNGLDINAFQYSKEKHDYLLALGLITESKGIHFALLTAKALNMDLIIAGTKDEEYYEEVIKPHITHDLSEEEHKLDTYLLLNKKRRKVVYTGPVTDKQKKPLYANAKCFLHPTCFEDPFPTVVIEAAAAGTPIVAFGRGGVPEMIEQGKIGFAVENIEEMIEMTRKIVKTNVINPADCRKHAEKEFSYKRMANDYLNIYNILIEEFVSTN